MSIVEPDFTTDGDGERVSEFITEALEALYREPTRRRVLCHWYQDGRIGYWSKTGYLDGDVVDTAEEYEYKLDFASTREEETVNGLKTIGYAEFIPMEHER